MKIQIPYPPNKETLVSYQKGERIKTSRRSKIISLRTRNDKDTTTIMVLTTTRRPEYIIHSEVFFTILDDSMEESEILHDNVALSHLNKDCNDSIEIETESWFYKENLIIIETNDDKEAFSN